MKRLLIALLLGTSLAVQAEVYKTIDANGNVVFSDTPVPGAEEIKLPPVPTYSAPKPKGGLVIPPSAADDQDGAMAYTRVAIIKPAPEETIRDNTGNIAVEVALTPALQADAGHRIQFIVDGIHHGDPATATTITLPNVDRGSHNVSATVIDSAGKVVATTGKVTFFVRRHSVNF